MSEAAIRRARRLAAAPPLNGPIALGTGLTKSSKRAVRRRRHLVMLAAAHLRCHRYRSQSCSRELICALTERIEREVTGKSRARGVNPKAIQRDDVCDRLYRSVRGLPARPPWPRDANGVRLSTAEARTAAMGLRGLAAAFRSRAAELDAATDDELSELRRAMLEPMPLARRIARFAPPVSAPAARRVDADLRSADGDALALLFRAAKACSERARSSYLLSRRRQAVRLTAIHRAALGLP